MSENSQTISGAKISGAKISVATISVAIVANDPLARAGLAMLLGNEPACDIVAQMSLADWLADLQEWPLLASEPQVDGVVWDVGWALPMTLPEEEPFPLPVVALLPDETAVPHLGSLGIRAMLRRDTSAAAIVAALHAVLHGVAALDPAFVTAVLPGILLPKWRI